MTIGITNNKIENTPITATTTNDTTVASTSASTTNSIYDGTEKEVKVEKNVSLAIDKILEKVCEKYKKYGITVEQLKQNPVLKALCQSKEEALKLMTSEEKEQAIKAYEEAFDAAVKDSMTKDGKLDVAKVAKTANEYFVAISTKWSIEGFKEAQKNLKTKHSLMDRLVAAGCLPKGTTIKNTSPEQIKEAIYKFGETELRKSIDNLRYKKDGPGHKKGQPLSEEDKKAEEMRTFGRMLINSSEEEAVYFAYLLPSLFVENRKKASQATNTFIQTKEQSQNFATAMLDPELNKRITTTPDVNGNVMSPEEATEMNTMFVAIQTEENREASHAKSHEAFKQWFVQNGDAYKIAQAKVDKAKAEGVEPDLTKDEKQLLVEYNNFVDAGQSSEFIGTQLNDKLSKMFKEAHMAELNRDAYEMPSYRDVLNNVNTYIENHPETFTPEAKEQFNTAMDKATNGNYTTVKTGSDAKLNVPAKRSEDSVSNNADLGFTSKASVDSSKLAALKSQIPTTEEKASFKVDKNVTSTVDALNAEKLTEKFAAASTNKDKLNLIDKYYAKSTLLQEKLKQYVLRLPNPLLPLNAFPTVARKHLAYELAQAGKLKEEDIQKLNLAYSEKQMLLAVYQESQKEKQEV